MSSQKIEDWIKTKLEEGVDRQRLRKVLEKKGYNPEIVEELPEDKDKVVESRDQQGSEHSTSDLHQSLDEKIGSEENTIELGKKQDKDKPDNSVNKQDSGTSDNEYSKLSKEAEHLEGIAGNLKKDIESKWKPGLEVIILIGVLVLGAVFATSVQGSFNQFSDSLGLEDSQPVENSEPAQNTSDKVDDTLVKLEDGLAKPSRPAVSSNENVVFQNNEDYGLELEFEGEKTGFKLDTGKQKTAQFNSITYYTATPNSEEGNDIKGSITIQ